MYPGDSSAPAREVCNCHCVYIEHVLGKDESIYDGKVVKANTSKSAETLTGKGLKYIMQTGGKENQQVQTRPGNSKKRDFLAEEYYERIRKIDDINQIAKASGLSEAKIRKIKKHVFFDKHMLYEGYKRFPGDYDMAVAWKRLSEGKPEERDIILLKHELLEMKHEKSGKYKTLSEAHHQAKKHTTGKQS